jgi:polyhydroxybutyrate depolymerase
VRRVLVVTLTSVVSLLVAASCGGDGSPSSAQPAATAATAVATAASGASPTASTPPPGTETREVLTVAGVQREAIVYVPARLPAGPAPVIFVLHGNLGTADVVSELYGFRQEADRLGFVAVFPNGTRRLASASCCSWNSGIPWSGQEPPDDVGFIRQLLDVLANKYPVDTRRVLLAGFSNGALMSARLACEMPERIAAFAAMSGQQDDSACQISGPIPVLQVHGTTDPVVPYRGGVAVGSGVTLAVPAVQDVVDFWRKHDACPPESAVTMLTPTVEQRHYGPCQGGSEVVLVTVQGGGHCWFGVPCTYGPQPDQGFKLTPLVVQFLLKQTRAGR